MFKVAVAALTFFLPAVPVGAAAAGEMTGLKCGSVIATSQAPVTIHVQGEGGGGAALEVTARPLATDPSTPFLVQVYVKGTGPETAPQLLGSFSFFPARIGQAQTFVLPKPETASGSLSKGVALAIKLIPANPARELKDVAVEILGARVVD